LWLPRAGTVTDLRVSYGWGISWLGFRVSAYQGMLICVMCVQRKGSEYKECVFCWTSS
jgi:hypothetical protein